MTLCEKGKLFPLLELSCLRMPGCVGCCRKGAGAQGEAVIENYPSVSRVSVGRVVSRKDDSIDETFVLLQLNLTTDGNCVQRGDGEGKFADGSKELTVQCSKSPTSCTIVDLDRHVD